MKKTTVVLTALKKLAAVMTTLTLALLIGCDNGTTSEPDTDPVSDTNTTPPEVRFQAAIDGAQARAVGTAWSRRDAIGVSMLESGGTKIVNYASNRRYVTEAGNGSFAPASGVEPIKVNQKVDFIAYYPYTDGMNGFRYPVDVSNQGNQEAIDLLTAEKAAADQNTNPVALNFKHRLSGVVVKITAGDNMQESDLAGLQATITGQTVRGWYDINANKLSPSTEGVNQSIAFKMEADGKTGVAVILPASGGSGRTMKLTLKTPDSMKVTFTKKIADDKAFEPGVRYQFPITLYRPSPSASFDEIVAEGGFVGTAEIEDWEDVVVEPDEVSPDGTEVPDTPTRTLASIAISTQPTKTTYMVGESLSTTGMVVTATYSDNTAAAVTSYTTSGFNSSSAGQKTVTVSYTEGGVTKTTSFSVTINPATGSGTVDITTPGDALAAGLSFSPEQPTNGYSATFTVTAPASFDSYKWLIDGAVQIGTSNEFTITVSTLLSGSHSVTVIAEKNGKPYSATKTFKVR